MVSIPSSEPAQLASGDTWQWSKSFTDYPSPTWTLTYYLRRAEDRELRSFTGSADGNGGFDILVPAATTAAYPSGRYDWSARVSAAGVVHTVARGFIDVSADFFDLANDHRTYNQRCLDAIEAVREGRANTDQASFTINDRSVSRMSWDELEDAWHLFRNLVAKERGIKVGRVKIRM
jgi:hypothetical protein